MKKKLLFIIAAFGAASLLFAAEKDQDRNDEQQAGTQGESGMPRKNKGQEKKADKEAGPSKEAAPAGKAGAGRRPAAPAGTIPPAGTWTRPGRKVPAEGRPPRAIRPAAGTAVPGVKAQPGRPVPRAETRPRLDQVKPGVNAGPAKALPPQPDVIIYKAPGPAPARRPIMRNDEAFSSIRREQRAETMRDHYYWHRNGGLRYAHYFDRHDAHWYGFYRGRGFYWCRYYGDRWWRHDSARARWLYWWSGYWWWRGPASVVFVYVDNNYYPYEMSPGITVVRAPDTENPPQPPPSPDMGRLWTSPDDSRLVQVYGDGSDAFLYDHSNIPQVYLAYLGRSVVDVKFTEDPDDQVTVFFKDGTMAAYDLGGHPAAVPASEPPRLEPPPAPESAPPAPESVPED